MSCRLDLVARQGLVPQLLELRQPTGLGAISSLSIALGSRLVAWRLAVFAELASGQRSRLGAVVVPAPTSRDLGVRVVAMATAPGAVGWMVEAMPDGAPADPREVGFLELAASDVSGAVPLRALLPAELVGERRRQVAGIIGPSASATLTILTTQRVRRVSAWQVGTGCRIAVTGMSGAATLPPDGAASVDLDVAGTGAGTVVVGPTALAGSAGYLVDYVE
jgi:hypothetical protein